MYSTLGKILLTILLATMLSNQAVTADTLSKSVQKDYDKHLGALFDYFHRNPNCR